MRSFSSAVRGSALALGALAMLTAGGCTGLSDGERSAYVTLTEVFGAQSALDNGDDGSGSGSSAGGNSAADTFRSDMTLTMQNASIDSEVNFFVAAWVNPSSIRSGEQQDALLRGGYVQLTREVQLGSAFTLAPGTFVLNGDGIAGAQKLIIPAAGGTAQAPGAPAARSLDLITPDVVLLFLMPPVACDVPAFYFSQQGVLSDTETIFGSSGGAGLGFVGGAVVANSDNAHPVKTLRQIPGYDCDPLRPGFFLKTGGGAKGENEYFEGENITVTFFPLADAEGRAAFVDIGG